VERGARQASHALTESGAHGPFFRRYAPPDPDELCAEIARERENLAAARARGDEAAELESATALGHELFIAGSEAQAAPLLDEALVLARRRGDTKAEIAVLLGLATARQYLGERELAQRLFEQGLQLCASSGIREQEHFLLHHQGRCFVEQGKIAQARAAFEKALAIRKALGNKRFVDSSQAALDDIAAM
jgi:tetratricopeptide (TPR) repeat protein